MTVLRQLTIALIAALAAATLYVVARLAVPVAVGMAASRMAHAGVGAASAYVSGVEVLAVGAVTFGGVFAWQVRSRRKG